MIHNKQFDQAFWQTTGLKKNFKCQGIETNQHPFPDSALSTGVFKEDSCINDIATMEWGLLLLTLRDVVVQA